MTTTVKIITGDCPAKLCFSDTISSEGDGYRTSGFSNTEEFIPPHTEREVHITDTRDLVIEELPRKATNLDYEEDEVASELPTRHADNNVESAGDDATGD